MTVCFDSDLSVVASRDAPLSRLHSYQDMYHQRNIENLNCRSYKKINHHTRKDTRDWSRGLAIAYVRGAEPKYKVFHYILIRLSVGLI